MIPPALVLFAIQAGVKLGQKTYEVLVDSTQAAPLVLPLGTLAGSIREADAVDFFDRKENQPLVAPGAFWTVAATLEAAGLNVKPYHAYVPSFGEWGFMLTSADPIADTAAILPGNRFLTPAVASRAFDFPPDMAKRPMSPNRLDNQALVRVFDAEWSRYEG